MANEWQIRCTTELARCIALGNEVGRQEWDRSRTNLHAESQNLGHSPPRVIIAGARLAKADLKRWRFDFCYLTAVDLTDADLQEASFDRAMLRGCRLVRADLRGAHFNRTSIDSATLGWSVRIDKSTKLAFTGLGDGLSGFDPRFRRKAEEDQRISDIRSDKFSVVHGWYYIIDYGRSIWRVMALLFAVSILFGTFYKMLYMNNASIFSIGKWTWYDFVIMSAQRLINAPTFIESKISWVQSIFLFEASIGYAALALLAAVLIRKLTILE